MCSVRMGNPCDPRCPNAPDPPTSTPASIVEPIVPGDEFYEIECDYYHEDCFTVALRTSGQPFRRQRGAGGTDGEIPKFPGADL